MKNDESLKCFEGNMPVEDVQKNLEKFCSKVKFKKNKFIVKHDKTDFYLFRKNEGYYAAIKPSIGAIFLVFLVCLLVFVMFIVLLEMVLGAIPACLMGWAGMQIYYSTKRKDLQRFCEEARKSA